MMRMLWIATTLTACAWANQAGTDDGGGGGGSSPDRDTGPFDGSRDLVLTVVNNASADLVRGTYSRCGANAASTIFSTRLGFGERASTSALPADCYDIEVEDDRGCVAVGGTPEDGDPGFEYLFFVDDAALGCL